VTLRVVDTTPADSLARMTRREQRRETSQIRPRSDAVGITLLFLTRMPFLSPW
jgi:hypothetical protein